MKEHRHRIHRDKALDMIEKFKYQKNGGKGKFDEIPEAFQFDAQQVRELLKHPNASYFLVRMGWKNDTLTGKAVLSPVLCVCDEDNQVIEEEDIIQDEPLQQGMMRGFSFGDSSEGEEVMTIAAVTSGGYLDESKPIPPPPIKDTPR